MDQHNVCPIGLRRRTGLTTVRGRQMRADVVLRAQELASLSCGSKLLWQGVRYVTRGSRVVREERTSIVQGC